MDNDKTIYATGVCESLRAIWKFYEKYGIESFGYGVYMPLAENTIEFPESFDYDLVFILDIESKLGWKLGAIGVERAMQLKELGASADEVVEALTLL